MERSPLLGGEDAPSVESRTTAAAVGGAVAAAAAVAAADDAAVAVDDAGTPWEEMPWDGRGEAQRRRSSSSDSGTPATANEELYIQQAVVFIEDAIKYRSIYHRMDVISLRLYRFYYSVPFQCFLTITILLLLALAFVERPSSLTRSADVRWSGGAGGGGGGGGGRRPDPPCGVTESVELTALLVLAMDVSIKAHLLGWTEFWKSKWLVAYVLVLALSLLDWTASIATTCVYALRVRRAFRPFFLLQNSSLMKKTLKCIRRTLPQIASVMLLLALHLYFFTVLGMLLFQRGKVEVANSEWDLYFETFTQSLTSLLVLLTTANNPDVMIPAYSANRLYAVFFLAFSVIGTYFLMNLLTAIIYNQFRGYLVNSIRTMLLRRRVGVRAAFEILSAHELQRNPTDAHEESVTGALVMRVLRTISVDSAHRKAMIQHLSGVGDGSISSETFQKIFEEMDKDTVKEVPSAPQYDHRLLVLLQRVCRHRYFDYVGNVFALANVLCITVSDTHTV
uniref:Two pore calcium channel protein 2-like n=1 Tax=Petromyzon marinus TaxID=7757 RepID=A0AAJ7UIQ0_PETMA|nr:two pore calcium channel protein 2-like [Petromyzon marinus]XP_032837207.1 two pore calcium channel protein 2-like [Petromyzon marinus]XP_032837208.1 two pore calcium channel protein 2-like [Petromyzon marinus]XP_032837209.1 two pore calcium channel protein 2-like [Petromyzon marinus]XP_032837210.1 two pore calcium channel protein 2-like [Petromyzon marinus]